jgi:uncharacterized protein (TIGR01244 family)
MVVLILSLIIATSPFTLAAAPTADLAAARQASAAPPASGVVKDTLPGATNVTRVDAMVMCGGATSPAAFSELKKRGFVSVINLRRNAEPDADIPGAEAAAAAAGLKFIHIPVDAASPDPASADAFLNAVKDRSNQPVYIHCASANRAAAMWLIKRMVVDGWDAGRASEEAATIGLTNLTLKQFALDYANAHRK